MARNLHGSRVRREQRCVSFPGGAVEKLRDGIGVLSHEKSQTTEITGFTGKFLANPVFSVIPVSRGLQRR